MLLFTSLHGLLMQVEFRVCLVYPYIGLSISNDCEFWKNGILIKLPFGMVSEMGQKKDISDGHLYWHHLANMVKRLCIAAICGSDTRCGNAAFSQISLGKLLYLLLK